MNEPVEVQVDEIRAKLKRLNNQLDELEGQLSAQGLVGGSTAMLSTGRIGFGSVIEDGRPAGRLDNTGIQMRVPPSTAANIAAKTNPAIWFVDEFQETSLLASAAYPVSSIYPTQGGNPDATLIMKAEGSSADRAAVEITGDDVIGGTVRIRARTQAKGTEGTVYFGGGGTTYYAQAFDADLWVIEIPGWATTNPSGFPNDGCIWYRQDTDKLHVRVNSATREVAFLGTGSTLTIATGAVTVTTGWHLIDTEAAAATDDLDTINGTVAGQIYVFQAANSARDVVFTEAGNLKLAGGAFTANNVEDTITMISNGTNLYELARSDNGA